LAIKIKAIKIVLKKAIKKAMRLGEKNFVFSPEG